MSAWTPFWEEDGSPWAVVATLDDPEACWSFDSVVLIQRGDEVRIAHDSGCSCPVPFESYKKPEDADAVTTYEEVFDFVDRCWNSYSRGQSQLAAMNDFLSKSRVLLARPPPAGPQPPEGSPAG